MKFKARALAAASIALYAFPALAHHSFAMFDGTKRLTLQGTVKDFQWTFPHCWIVLMVPDATGQMEQWPIEMMPPSYLAKYGWLPKTLTPGMKVTAVIHPLKEGKHGGQYLGVTLPDGKTLGLGNENKSTSAGGGTE